MGKVITIDGPAASGKTSLSRELARHLDWHWLSTGAFYRGLAFVALQSGLELGDESSLAQLATSDLWKVITAPSRTQVFYEENDVTDFIAHEDVGSFASRISGYPLVRKALLEAQQAFGQRSENLVAEGRDCGTVIFPQAVAKVYLTARQDLRAQRRADEQGLSPEETLSRQVERDQQDTRRAVAPLQVAEGALVLDTSALNLEETLALVLNFVMPRI